MIAVHGRNQDRQFMETLVRQLDWDHQTVLFPRAADRTWYPDKFMEPYIINQEGADAAVAMVQNQLLRLKGYGYKTEEIVLLGFSQGACVVSQFALLNPDRYRAVVVFTGGYLGEEGVEWAFSGDFQQTPVYVSTSEVDEWVPPSRARETAMAFERLNARVTLDIFEHRPHEVSQEEIERVASMIYPG